MRRLVPPLLAILIGAPVAVAATGTSRGTTQPVVAGKTSSTKLVLAEAAGDIKALGLSRITVGRLTCSVPSGMPNVSRFVIGDPVAIACKGGTLKSIKDVPIASAASNSTSTVATSTVVKSSSTSSGGSGGSFVSTWGTITLGGSTSPPSLSQGPTATASGPITALDSTRISIGDVTCFFPSRFSTLYQFLTQTAHVQVGDSATIRCTVPSSDTAGSLSVVILPH